MFIKLRLSIIALFLCGFLTSFVTAYKYPLDDDLLYFYTMAQSFTEPAEHAAAIAQARELTIAAQPEGDSEPVMRFDFRAAYQTNYLFHEIIMSVTRLVLKPGADGMLADQTQYLENVRYVVYAGTFTGHMLCLFLVFAIVWRTQDRRLLWGYFAALLLSYAACVLGAFQFYDQQYYRIVNGGLLGSVTHSFHAFFDPGLGFSLFYTNARNAFTILLTGVFLLRAQNKTVAAYWLLAAASLVHTTCASLSMIVVVGLDYLYDPAALKNRKVIVPILASVFMGLAQSIVWSHVGSGLSYFSLLPALIFPVLLLEKYANPVRKLFHVDAIGPEQRVYADGIALGFVLFFICFFVWIFFHHFGERVDTKYTLGELPIRMIGLLRFPVLMGLFVLLYDFMSEGVRRKMIAVAMGLMAVLFLSSAYLIHKLPETAPASGDFRSYKESRKTCHSPFAERVLYYLMACKTDGVCRGFDGENYLERCYRSGHK